MRSIVLFAAILASASTSFAISRIINCKGQNSDYVTLVLNNGNAHAITCYGQPCTTENNVTMTAVLSSEDQSGNLTYKVLTGSVPAKSEFIVNLDDESGLVSSFDGDTNKYLCY